MRTMHAEGRYTIISITHDVEEMAEADRMIVLDGGMVTADGSQGSYCAGRALQRCRLKAPFALQLCRELKARGSISASWLGRRRCWRRYGHIIRRGFLPLPGPGMSPILGLDGLHLELEEGRMIAVLGSPGSGKSTLLQHMNGLIRADEGLIRILDFRLEPGDSKKVPAGLRRASALFSIPGTALFEETVEKDLLFGPLNFGRSPAEAPRRSAERHPSSDWTRSAGTESLQVKLGSDAKSGRRRTGG